MSAILPLLLQLEKASLPEQLNFTTPDSHVIRAKQDDDVKKAKLNTIVSSFFSRLLVGAPTADSRQPQVTKGGAVYKCNPDAPGSCEMIPFDTKGKRQCRKCSRKVLYFLDFFPEMHFLKVQKKLDLRNTAL